MRFDLATLEQVQAELPAELQPAARCVQAALHGAGVFLAALGSESDVAAAFVVDVHELDGAPDARTFDDSAALMRWHREAIGPGRIHVLSRAEGSTFTVLVEAAAGASHCWIAYLDQAGEPRVVAGEAHREAQEQPPT